MVALNDVAATLMEHMAAHDEGHGYAQDARYGDGSGRTCPVTVGGRTYRLRYGDSDCSEGTAYCWRKALEGTPYEGALDGGTYTGNMRQAFVASGLFEWKPMSFIAQRGDLYLVHQPGVREHQAMCISDNPDMLAEFACNSFGGVSGDAMGDQTGRECYVHPYYDAPWDGILHYIGPDAVDGASGAAGGSASLPCPRYRVCTYEDGWLEWMDGLSCSDGCGDDFAGMPGHVICAVEIAAESLGPSGWFQIWKEGRALPKGDSGYGIDGAVTGVTVYYDTPDPAATGYYEAIYRVAPIGGEYLKWEHDDNDNGAGGAGPIDRFQLAIGRI